MIDGLPRRVVAWYGDDFTGSTDVLEMLSLHGLRSVLFLRRPDEPMLANFSDYRALGLAGSSRSRSPEWMDLHLPEVFRWLAETGAPVCHYKVCSTFDSSPETGSIGRALEIGQRVMGTPVVPIVAGAPALGRYTAVGHLFAAAGNEVFRIDRHPTMSRHPVTPMAEADLREHLARQTSHRIGLVSFVDLGRTSSIAGSQDAVLIDVLDDRTLVECGRLIWREAQSRQSFVVGSSGVEHALAAAWKSDGLYEATVPLPAVRPVPQILVLSGSCSPITQTQIAWALGHGFAGVRLDAATLAGGVGRNAAIESAADNAVGALAQGRSAVLYSAGEDGDVLAREVASQKGFRESLGRVSGEILSRVLDRSSVRRVVVGGGDTSSHAGERLAIDALTFVCPVAPGAPLCRAWSSDPRRNGLEIVFKGGQCGPAGFFAQVRGE